MPQVRRESAPRGRSGGTTHEATEPFTALNARIPRQLWQRVRLFSVQEDRLIRDFVTEAMREYLRSRQGRR